ncbi:MAG: 1-deoxy-D-xylulose-5-phosphate synthase, partial [Eubacteriales bacterium]|nr:1-deoxy-D-xylulose-5-phosphate synthase [Eubacteriales bacterium]
MYKVLDKINTPKDLKILSRKELVQLCGEIRQQMLLRLSETGGHVGSNLAIIEATVALHYIFDSPIDKIIFDVSHQCYTHKLLTGRKAAYIDSAKFSSVSGFTNPIESEHDIFSIGHTSTAISLACGLAKGRDVKGENYNVIALMGDGALSGGEAFEGLNNAAVLNSNIILIINDNDMSIAKNHGGLYQNLRLLRETDGKADCNFFRALGFDYSFVHDGNDFNEIVDALEQVKNTNCPVVVHMCTIKGKGYRFAETDKENWHYMGPFDIDTGKLRYAAEPVETYEALTAAYLAEKMRQDPTVTAITAGTPKVLGFEEELRNQFPKQFVDVGIAEGHAVAMISGIAKAGGKPVFGVSSSFLQRTYDQLSSDLALNHSSAVILVFFTGIGGGSQTHMGVFDISLAVNIPNIIYLAPTCKEEYFSILEWG